MFFYTQKKIKKNTKSIHGSGGRFRRGPFRKSRADLFENFLQGREIIHPFTRGCVKKILRKTSHVFLEEMVNSAGRDCTSRTSTTIGKTCLLSYVLATLGGLYRAFWSASKFLLPWEDVRPVDSCTFVSKRVQDLFA